MDISFVGFTLDVVGKLMVAFTAIMVHHRVLNEHTIDQKVFSSMKREQRLGLIGVALIAIGYILQVPAKLN